MTQKEIDLAKVTLPHLCSVPLEHWTKEQRHLDAEISCREMINSCLVYGGINGFWEECDWRFGDKSYAAPYVRALGLERVKELVSEQETDFSKAKVYRGVFTDSEGVTYSSIRWGDE